MTPQSRIIPDLQFINKLNRETVLKGRNKTLDISLKSSKILNREELKKLVFLKAKTKLTNIPLHVDNKPLVSLEAVAGEQVDLEDVPRKIKISHPASEYSKQGVSLKS